MNELNLTPKQAEVFQDFCATELKSHFNVVFGRLSRSRVSDAHQVANDIITDALFRVAKYYIEGKNITNFSDLNRLLSTACKNAATEYFRKNQIREKYHKNYEDRRATADLYGNVEDDYIKKEELETVKGFRKYLSPTQKRIFDLLIKGFKKPAEISEEMGDQTAAQVSNQLDKLRKKIRTLAAGLLPGVELLLIVVVC